MASLLSNWSRDYAHVKVSEGGNVDDKRDPGGRTSRGVTQRVYTAWRKNNGKPVADVYKMTNEEAASIYQAQYYDAVRGDDMPAGISLVLFDMAVNHGPKRALMITQAALNAFRPNALKIKVDGVMGEATFRAIMEDTDNDRLIAEIQRRRQGFYQGLSTFKTFGKGWTARNKHVTATAQAWASGSVGPVLDKPLPVAASMKALDADVKTTAVTTETAAQGAGGATVLSGLAETIQSTSDALTPYASLSDYIQYGIVGCAVSLALYSGYAAYKSRKATAVLNAEVVAEV